MDTAIHKGRRFWSGVFDAHDGHIRETHPYKRAKAADFHHSYYVSSHSQDAMKNGDAGFFWVDPDGSVNTHWRDDEAPKHIVDAIKSQIEPIAKNKGGEVDRNKNLAAFLKGNHPDVPHVVYHGSPHDIYSFDPDKAISEGGAFYFSKDSWTKPNTGARAAGTYAPSRGGSIYPVHISMKNPHVVGFTKPLPSDDAPETEWNKYWKEHENFDKQFDDERFKAKYFRQAIKHAQNNGHDGVIFKGITDDRMHNDIWSYPSDIFAVFDPRQIKSATGNRGTFDPSNPDITKDTGGGITAYHGSPHEFDEFDTSKIGTGEGAQAYGHGLYFAESEPVAQEYRDRLTDVKTNYRVGNYDIPKWILRKIEDSPDREDMINVLKNEFNNRIEQHKQDEQTSSQPWLATERISYAKDILAGLEELRKGQKIPHTRGRMYEVHIDAHPDHFLDWDKPLSEQPRIIEAFNKIHAGKDPLLSELLSGNDTPMEYFGLFPKSKGSQAYNTLADQFGGHEKASKLLSEHGVHGIKYFDAGSRGSAENKTRNYVVFDHNRVKVKRRYEQGGKVEGREAFGFGGETEFAGSGPVRGASGSAVAASQPTYGGGPLAGSSVSSGFGNMGGGGGGGGGPQVSFPGTGGGSDPVRAAMESSFPTKVSGFPGAPTIGMPQSLKELQSYKTPQPEEDQQQQGDLFSQTLSKAINIPQVTDYSFGMGKPPMTDPSKIGMQTGPTQADITSVGKYGENYGPMSYQTTQQALQGEAAKELQRQAQAQFGASPASFSDYFQTPTTQVAKAEAPPPVQTASAEYNVKFDPVTQGFVKTTEPQVGSLTQIAMAAPPAFPHTPTPTDSMMASVGQQSYPRGAAPAQAAGTFTAAYDRPIQLAQAATGLTIPSPQLTTPSAQAAGTFTSAYEPKPTQLAQAATGLTIPSPTAQVPVPMPRPTEPTQVATAPSVSQQDALVLPGQKLFGKPQDVPLPPVRPSDYGEGNLLDNILKPFGLDSESWVTNKADTYTKQGMNPRDAYTAAQYDLLALQKSMQTPSDRGGPRRRLVRKLMPDGTYQDVYEDYASGGRVFPLKNKHEGKTVEMTPQEYLRESPRMKMDEKDSDKIDKFKKKIKKGKKIGAPKLLPNHMADGRHRATAAMEMGIKKIPVLNYRKRDGGAIVDRALMLISKKA